MGATIPILAIIIIAVVIVVIIISVIFGKRVKESLKIHGGFEVSTLTCIAVVRNSHMSLYPKTQRLDVLLVHRLIDQAVASLDISYIDTQSYANVRISNIYLGSIAH